jgi:ribulose-5-phosphate 4-epimerase/fuculose-1-phosphate aldolase
MQIRVSLDTLGECSADEWQARVDLAAAHRLALIHGFSEGIFNHLTFVVPGRSDCCYQIPFGMHWSEVSASSFMEVGIDDGKVKRGAGDVEQPHTVRGQGSAANFQVHGVAPRHQRGTPPAFVISL